MALKTVICLSFSVLNNFFANMCQGHYKGGGKSGRRPPKQNSSPPNCPAYPPKLSLPLQQFQNGCFFLWKPTETSEKSRPYWRDDLFFFISTENLVKTRPTQKFWPLQKQIFPPFELRSSCGIDMCVKKIVPHQPEASPHVTGTYLVP